MSDATTPTFKSLADGLSPKLAAYVHADWRKNEAEYWANRETLLADYNGLWIGYANGVVIASGKNSVDVLHDAVEIDKRSFCVCVGAEQTYDRIRRRFDYDFDYQNQSMPVIDVEFRDTRGKPGITLDHVIPDTGSDASTIPLDDCPKIGLDPDSGWPGRVMGVGGTSSEQYFSCVGS